MTTYENSNVTATIKMISQEKDSREISAPILARTLTGFQQIVYLLAASLENKNIGQRFRISNDLQQLYTLKCQIPQVGSYALPVFLESNLNSQSSIFTNYETVINNLEILLTDLSNNSLDKIKQILPDSKIRNRVLTEFRKFIPKAGEGWILGFHSKNKPDILVTESVNSYIDNWLNVDISEEEIMTVTGDLIRIDFDKRTVVIKYQPTHQEIECIYIEELEDALIENRRQLIQVTGKFTLDNEGHPVKLTDVNRIEPVDLSPFLLREVNYQNTKLRLKNPLKLTPIMDEESSQLFVVEDANINLYVFAYTREDLIHEINEQIVIMWDEYVKDDIEKLAEDAFELRQVLLETFEEVN
ncbi:hypothetical protein [Geminocystis sp. NIES-3709]|uniref:hypothetical protein n=1 Tax=Geminocystis sp. NIES-3709 TaxID=1617448 RepID=UPI00082698C2|nr:hypothetical protein [Geminocystis sp. NIES-3709]